MHSETVAPIEPLIVDHRRLKTPRPLRSTGGPNSFNPRITSSAASTRSSELSSVGDFNVGTSGETMEQPTRRRPNLTASLTSQESLLISARSAQSESPPPPKVRRRRQNISNKYKGKVYKYEDHD